jgi:steroid delta-isomerase-like uncharacterized protein
MSAEESREIARRYATEFWSEGNAGLADGLLAPDYVVHDPGMPDRPGGIEGEKGVLATFRAVFPDLRFDIEDVVGEEDRGVVRWTAHGTHRGEFMGLAPTGKRMSMAGISIYRIAGGKIVEHWGVWDTLGMLQQMGAMPAQAATA